MSPQTAAPLFKTRVLPVIALENADDAVPMAEALLAGGIDAMEITLRTAAALEAVRRVAAAVPGMCVGAGTLARPEDFQKVIDAGARFAISPGLTPALARAGAASGIAYWPGVMTPSEALAAREYGFMLVKLFPAQQAGGIGMLQAMAPVFPDLRFCPTGGITAETAGAFLKLQNVAMIGGSWLTPKALVQARDWAAITALAAQASALGG